MKRPSPALCMPRRLQATCSGSWAMREKSPSNRARKWTPLGAVAVLDSAVPREPQQARWHGQT